MLPISILLGIVFVTLIDVIGSITSRKLNYLYVYLTPLSFGVYTFIGYYASQGHDIKAAIVAAALVGIYDGTVGWKLAIVLNANLGENRERLLQSNVVSRVVFMLGVGFVFGFLGFVVANWSNTS